MQAQRRIAAGCTIYRSDAAAIEDHMRINILLLLVMLGLTACQPRGGAPTPSAAPSAAPSVTATSAATSTPAVTLVPTGTATAAATATTLAPSATATEAATATTAATSTPATTATTAATATPTIAAATGTATAAATAAATTTAPAGSPTPTGSAGGPNLRGTIAFVREGDIYSYSPQTGATTLLIDDGRDMRFSPDGTQLAFVRDDGVYLAAADGSNIRQIAAQTSAAAPQWSDDGTKLLFEQVLDPLYLTRSAIWTIDLPGGAARRIAEGLDPAWAPDSKRITYVTPRPSPDQSGPRRNELHLVNWLGQNDWAVVRSVPANTPPTGVPGNEIPAAQLEHLLFGPVWDAQGRFIYVPAIVTSQVETDFTILERADAINGGSTYLETVYDVRDTLVSPDRRGVVLISATARGDVSLTGRALNPGLPAGPYSWIRGSSPREITYLHFAPSWSPDSDALVTIRCSEDAPGSSTCELVLFAPGLEQPRVLVPDLLQGGTLDYRSQQFTAWGR